MTLAIHPPSRSALGVPWCEDFRRGRLGVRKNQGTFHGSGSNIVDIRDGGWAKFPGNSATYIDYPRLNTYGATQFTLGGWFRKVVDTSTDQLPIGQSSGDGWPLDTDYQLTFNVTLTRIVIGLTISGSFRTAETTTVSDFQTPFLVFGTWESGSKIKLFLDGVEVAESSAAYAGTINAGTQPLVLGRRSVSAWNPFRGEMKRPLVEFRKWSADEIQQYFRGSLF